MTEEADEGRYTPAGIILVCLMLGLYGLFWIMTWVLAVTAGNGSGALLSMIVAVGVLVLAYFLYLGSRTAWWVSVAVIGGSALWRLSLVAGGEPSNLLNAGVGVLAALYLFSKRDYYRPTPL